MEKFIDFIRENDKKLNDSYAKKELKNIQIIMDDLEDEHQDIKNDLKSINYLLELIEKHNIEASEKQEDLKDEENKKNWLSGLKNTFEKYHLMHANKLNISDIEFLKQEKNKLMAEKAKLEQKHKQIHSLIAKTFAYSVEIQNQICVEFTKGHDIAAISEKILEHFGELIEEETSYEYGRKKIVKFLEETYSINKIQAHKIFDILEKNKVITYKVNLTEVTDFPDYELYDTNYAPIFGIWYINA